MRIAACVCKHCGSMDLSSLQLVVLQPGSALDLARQALLATHWHDGMTAPQLLEREQQLLDKDAWTRSGALELFALTDAAQSELFSSCEAWAMRAAVRDATGVAEMCTYGIASVFTAEGLRGNGLASELLRRVRTRLGAATSLLMCEVAPAIYERVGYAAPHPEAKDWELAASECGFEMHAQSGVRFLTAANLPAHAELLCARIRGALAEAVPGAFAVLPSAEQLQWHISRDAARRKVLSLPAAPASVGAACGDAFALWAFDTEDHSDASAAPVLRILAFAPSHTDADADAAVLAAAVQCAGAARTLLWSTDALTLRSYAGGEDASWTPPEDELAFMGVSARCVSRQCLPMWTPPEGVEAAQWRYIPRGVWI